MIPARGPQTMFHHYHRMAFICLQSFGRLRLALLCLCMLVIALPYFASRIQKLCDIQLLLYCLSPADNACNAISLPNPEEQPEINQMYGVFFISFIIYELISSPAITFFPFL